MEYKIRPMRLEDIAQVREIDTLSFSMPWPERSFRFELSENKSTRLWVCEIEDEEGSARVVAMMVLWVIIDEGHIGTFAVHPDYRRMGMGRRLLAKALLEAAREGVTNVYLEVRRSNTAAQKLYEDFGFRVDGIRPRYYRDTGEDALLMRLEELDAEKIFEHGGKP